jgi:two-component system, OmpR family, KDP operon response regulator KdpE
MTHFDLLVIEDDTEFRSALLGALNADGHSVTVATRVAEALHWIQQPDLCERFDLVLLDLNFPDGHGETVLRKLRTSRLPVIVISADGEEKRKIQLLDLGADDYLVKPFSFAELLARIRASLRKKGMRIAGGHTSYNSGGLHIEIESHRVTLHGQPVHCTPTEFKLLERLVRNTGEIVKHRELLRHAWGEEHIDQTHYLRLYMSQLRNKLEQTPANPEFIITEPGVGYMLAVQP